MDSVTLAFAILGALLIASELLHLSLVPLFLGVSALAVAGLRGLGLLESLPASLLAWSLTSVALTLPLRPIVRRMLGAGERRVDHSHEDKDAMGAVVEVAEPVSDQNDDGRIRFQGTTWAARAVEGTIARGASARLVYKDKLVWVVEPLGVLDDAHRVPEFKASAEVKR